MSSDSSSSSEPKLVTQASDDHIAHLTGVPVRRRSNSSSYSSSDDYEIADNTYTYKAVHWKKYRIGSRFALFASLAAACGSFLFGMNIGLLNASIGVITSELYPCDYTETVLDDNCKKVLARDPSFDFARCNLLDVDPECTVLDEFGEEDTCVPPTPIGCSAVSTKNSFLNCAMLVGAAIGSLSCKPILDAGRRRMNFIAAIVYFFGIVSSCVSNSYSALIWARLIVGVAVGLGSVQCPTFISEMTPLTRKGFFGVFHQLFITIGILVPVLLGLPFDAVEFSTITAVGNMSGDVLIVAYEITQFNKVWWRVLLACGILPLIINCFMFMRLKCDTPKYYLGVGRNSDAKECLKRIYADDDVDDIFVSMYNDMQESKKSQEAGMTLSKAFKIPEYRNVILIGCATSAAQQLSGINVFMVASNQLFGQIGLSFQTVTTLSVILTALNVIMTFPAPFLIEKLGRKSLLYLGAIGQCVGIVPAAVMFWAMPDTDASAYVAIVGSYIFIISFAIAFGPVLWVWMTEIFPSDISAVATGLLVGTNWVTGIIMVFVGTVLTDNKISFTVFGVLNILCLLHVMFLVKETKGLQPGESPYITSSR